MRTLVFTSLPTGVGIGMLEVGIPAFSRAEGAAAAAGVLLAIWSFGSGIGGLLYGTLPRRAGLHRTHLFVGALLPLTLLPLAAAPSVWVMALLVIPAGCCIAPLLATRNELVGGVAPPGMRTEAYTWPITSFVGGIAVGAALSGVLVEGPGWRTAFVVAAGFAAGGAVLAALRRQHGGRRRSRYRPERRRSVHGSMTDPLAQFTPQVREWFGRAFAAPTAAQAQAWPAIATGEHVLISAPTGSGKTLAAFLYGLDRFVARPSHEQTRLVYVSPLKALSYDVEKNLRAPLRGIGADLNVAIRTGDTPQKERRDMVKHPPDVLITTPESLYLMLTSQARAIFEGTETVILDEIHAVAQTKRGAHLAITLERLVEQARPRRPARRALAPRRTRSRRSGASWSARSAGRRWWTPACASRWT